MFIIASRGKQTWLTSYRIVLHTYCVQVAVELIEMHQIHRLPGRIR